MSKFESNLNSNFPRTYLHVCNVYMNQYHKHIREKAQTQRKTKVKHNELLRRVYKRPIKNMRADATLSHEHNPMASRFCSRSYNSHTLSPDHQHIIQQ